MKAVIFDLDDTLILELDYVKSGYRAVSRALAEEGTFALTKEELYDKLTELFEESPKNVFNRLFENLGKSYSKDDIMRLVDIYRTHDPDIDILPDAKTAVNSLKEAGSPIGILSDGYLVTQQKKVAAIGADKIFDQILLTDEFGRDYWKPSVKGFEILAERLNTDLRDMIYVGDNPNKDFEIMKGCPIKTVRIMREHGVYLESGYGGECRENIRLKSLEGLPGAIRDL